MNTPPAEHPFILELGQIGSTIIQKYEGIERDQLPDLLPHENYVHMCLFATTSLIECCERMQHATMLMSGFRKRPQYPEFTRLDYVVYHIENHLVRAVGVSDRALQLINCVFNIALPERCVSEATTAENYHVRRTPVRDAWRSLDSAIRPLRKERNIVVHRHSIREKALDQLAPFYLIKRYGYNAKFVEQSNHLYKIMTDRVVRAKQEELDVINGAVFERVEQFLDAVHAVFTREYQSLKPISMQMAECARALKLSDGNDLQ